MSENRSLAVPEILVHQFSALPDKYVLAAAEIPDDIPIEGLNPDALPDNWMTLIPREQHATKRIGDEWIERRESAVLAVPSVIVGELDYLLNPAHLDFQRIRFAEPVLFRFDLRFIARNQSVTPGEAKPQAGLV